MQCNELLEWLAEFVQSPNADEIKDILATLDAFPECLHDAACLVARAQLFSGEKAGSECYSRLELIQYFNHEWTSSQKVIADHVPKCNACLETIKDLGMEFDKNITAFKNNPKAALESLL